MDGKPEYTNAYRVVRERGSDEIIEKRSRFIANIAPAESEEEALKFIEEMKKKYWDARHNCWAYIVGKRSELIRFSDDGEPSGTAGKPMLEVLSGAGLTYTAAVVTRYFGGTLLGTGGLVRAYTQAVQAGLQNTDTAFMRYGNTLCITTDYNGVGKIQYLLEKRGIMILQSCYEEKVKIDIRVPYEETGDIQKAIVEATKARASVEITGHGVYADFS